MSDTISTDAAAEERFDTAPGQAHTEKVGIREAVQGYVIGLVLAVGLTIASFLVAGTGVVWGPGVPVMLLVLAVAQMGVHLAFFLHITTGPDNTNNVLALAFGLLIVLLVIAGSLWIMSHLSEMMPEMGNMTQMPGDASF